MRDDNRSIAVVIPNWNGAKMLEHCLRSLARQSCGDFQVFVVDNGSTDTSLSLLETEFPDVSVIAFTENRGFSVAVNEGIRQSEAPFVLLLNNDMEVAPDCIENLLASVKRYPDYHFFALKMLSFNNRTVIDGAGDAAFRGGVGYRIGTMERDSELYCIDRECFGACGGAALYRREFFEQIDVFDEDFFAYLEDVDLNFRARRAGLRCMFLADSVVYHIGSATTGSKINSTTIRLSTRNNLNLLVKNYSLAMLLRFFPAMFVYQVMWFVFCLKKRQVAAYFAGIGEAVLMFRKFWVKRKMVFGYSAQGSVSEFCRQITEAEFSAIQSIMRRREEAGKGNMLLQAYCRVFFLYESHR